MALKREKAAIGASERRYTRAGVRRAIRSVFFRMMVSYVFLVFLTAVGTSVVSYVFFQGKYNIELERIHMSMVRNIGEELTSRVVDTSKRIYFECNTELLRGSLEFFGEEDLVEGNFVKISETHRMLGELMGRYGDVVDGIGLYYRKADLILAFPSGARFKASLDSPSDYRPYRDFLDRKTNAIWTNPEGRPPRTFRCFPILSTPENCTVVVSISVRSDELERIISSASVNYSGDTYVVDGEGRVVAATSDEDRNEPLRRVFAELPRSSDLARSGFIRREKRLGAIVAGVPISDTGWTLVNVTPIALLYRKGDRLRDILIAICLASVVIGIGVSALLTARVYNPLDRLIGRVRRLFGADLPPPSDADDEYRLLDYAIEGLSSRMVELSATLERSRPLIKHEVASALLAGDVSYVGYPEDTLRALGIPLFPRRTVACLVRIREKNGEGEEMENRLLRYRIAEEMEKVPGRFAITSVFGDGGIGVIFGLEEREEGTFNRADAGRFIAEMETRFEVSMSVAVGTISDSPETIRESFLAAKKTGAYAYFFPDRSILTAADGFLVREDRREELPTSVFEELAEGVRRGNQGLAAAALASAVDFVRSDRASADVCRGELARLARSVAAIQAESFPASAGDYRAQAERTAALSTDVYAFRDAVLESIADYRGRLANPPDARTVAALAEATRIIDADLVGDLSLQRLGDAVGLSPGYLGKIFKASTGVNLVDYVTDRRLTRAAQLLSESNDDIQDIGRRVGFNSPAYFIKRFKERYGRTPYEYRRSLA